MLMQDKQGHRDLMVDGLSFDVAVIGAGSCCRSGTTALGGPSRQDERLMIETPIPEGQRRQQEWRAFLFLTVVLSPVLAVGIVAGFGFLIWIWQMFFGPPGA